MGVAGPQAAVPSEAQLEDFARDGFLVVRDAIPGELLERLIEAGDRLMATPALLGREDHEEFGIRGQREPVLFEEAFVDVLALPLILPLLVRILGANIYLVGSELIYTDCSQPIRTPERTLWHRDRMVALADLGGAHLPRLSVKAAYYLTDARSADAGMTLFARGSHRLEGPLPIPPGEIDPPEAVRPDVRPGDAVLFEHRTWHCQGFNGSGRVRKAVFMEYGYRWLRRRTREELFPEDLMDGRDPISRQLLGDLGPHPVATYARGGGTDAI